MTAAIIGNGAVAADIFNLFQRAGMPAVRVAVSDIGRAESIGRSELIVDACSLPPEPKRDMLRSLAKHCSRDAVLCSDEPVVPRHELLQGIDHEFRQRFSICHFFIPTANLTLVELVAGEEVDRNIQLRLTDLLERRLQRSVFKCPDTPGFVGNRIGLFFAFRSVLLAAVYGLRPDHADRILAVRFGLPKLGAFGLFDLIGFDVMNTIADRLRHRLPASDAWHDCDIGKNALLGRARAAAGDVSFRFYNKDKVTKERKVLDLETLDFIPCTDDVIDAKQETKFVAQLRSEINAYCVKVAKSTGVTPDVVDAVLCKGFGWQQGPFALLHA